MCLLLYVVFQGLIWYLHPTLCTCNIPVRFSWQSLFQFLYFPQQAPALQMNPIKKVLMTKRTTNEFFSHILHNLFLHNFFTPSSSLNLDVLYYKVMRSSNPRPIFGIMLPVLGSIWEPASGVHFPDSFTVPSASSNSFFRSGRFQFWRWCRAAVCIVCIVSTLNSFFLNKWFSWSLLFLDVSPLSLSLQPVHNTIVLQTTKLKTTSFLCVI